MSGGGKRGSRGDSDVPRDETGWIDDLRQAKKANDAMDFTSGGSDRWSKLSALSDGDGPPPDDMRPGQGRGRGRPAEPGGPRRRAADGPTGRRSPGGEVGRPRIEPDPEPPVRRSRPEPPEPPEPDAKTLIGRRARETDRDSSRRTPPPTVVPAPVDEARRRSPFSDGATGSGRGGVSRVDPAASPGRGSRRNPPPTVVPAPVDEPRRRSPFASDEPRRSPFADSANPTQSGRAEEPRRRSLFGERSAMPEERRRTMFSDIPGATKPPVPGGPGPAQLKPPLTPAPDLTGTIRPLRGAGAVLGAPAPRPVRPNSPAPPPPPGPPPARPRAGFAAGVQAIRGARSEVRRQLREQQRLRMWTLITLVVAIVGALPFYFVLRAATRDPVVTSLDALSVPAWAVVSKNDNITGSRWCLMACRYRERTAVSSKSIPETAQAYKDALVGAGWLPMDNVQGCEPTEQVEGDTVLAVDDHSCWRRDEFTLDLTVGEPECAQDKLRRRPGFDISPTPDPSAEASADPSASPTPSECSGSVVHIKVFNAVDDIRLRYTPEPSVDPEGGNLTDEDLIPTGEPTPTP